MIKKSLFKILSNTQIAKNVFEMKLSGDTLAIEKPGQFVNIALEGKYLRRPISVCDVEGDTLTLIYKVVGEGTLLMSKMRENTVLDVLTGLGNGCDISKSGEKPLLIGGGAGVPPMYLLARRLIEAGKKPCVILGFNTADEVFYEEKFKEMGCAVLVTTVDGSYGMKGFVTDGMDFDYSYFYCCGPEPMLKAVYKKSNTSGQFSFEERMGCGFGACMGCSCRTVTGYKRICKDGPVLEKEEILWAD